MKYHIHIYKIVSKAETNVNADNPTGAKIKALKRRKRLKYKKSDCDYIALDFIIGSRIKC